MKHARKILAAVCLLACVPWAAFASSHFGNYTLPTINTTDSQVINGTTGSAGFTQGVLETFSVPQQVALSGLGYYMTKVGSPVDTLSVRLCEGPVLTSTDPCQGFALGTWSRSMSSFPAFTAGVNPTETVENGNGITLYPNVTYGLVFTRSAFNSGVDNRLIETPSGYADGQAYNELSSCTNPYWVSTEDHTGAPTCTSTSKAAFDVVFDLVGQSASALTVNVRQNGPDVSFYGFCETPADLPYGWTLDSNLVSVLVSDTTSATGTSVLRTATCQDGAYDSGTGTLLLWNASYQAVATQAGEPVTFSATATFSVSGSDVPNPTALLSGCPFSLLDSLDQGAFTQALGCYLGTFAKNAVVIAPFSWYSQVTTAMQTSSATASYSIGVPVPSLAWNDYASSGSFSMDAAPRATVLTSSLYDSATATGAADVAAQKFPVLRTLAVVFLWLETGAWLAGLVWLFIGAL